mmetsp:Transcript_91978/g.263445  ORF Transcript_91978/g.263445 Transcript_91978/m.263445 type:complete len:233 (-) Transcript_91978:423-1121(-)
MPAGVAPSRWPRNLLRWLGVMAASPPASAADDRYAVDFRSGVAANRMEDAGKAATGPEDSVDATGGDTTGAETAAKRLPATGVASIAPPVLRDRGLPISATAAATRRAASRTMPSNSPALGGALTEFDRCGPAPAPASLQRADSTGAVELTAGVASESLSSLPKFRSAAPRTTSSTLMVQWQSLHQRRLWCSSTKGNVDEHAPGGGARASAQAPPMQLAQAPRPNLIASARF